MICPNCKTEYRDGFYICGDCNVDLVKNLNVIGSSGGFNPDEPLSGKLSQISVHHDIYEAEVVRAIMEMNEIRALIQDDHNAGVFNAGAANVDGIEVFVSEEDSERATRILSKVDWNSLRG